jgi:F-type H+-transporting ATPase subunit delta
MREYGVVKRYTGALFGLGKAGRELDRIEHDLELLHHDFEKNPRIIKVLTNPTLGREARKAWVQEQFRGKISETTLRFIGVLIAKGRMDHFDVIRQEFVRCAQDARGEINVHVWSPYEIGEGNQKRLVGVMEKKLRKKVRLDLRIHKELLAGLVIQFGSQVIDMCARSQLNIYRNTLLTAE